MFTSILSPIDGSPDGWIALDHAIDIAHEEAGTIHVLFVADSKLVETSCKIATMPESAVTEPIQATVVAGKQLAEYGEATLADAQARCARACVGCATEYVEGVVVNVILNRAATADLVVMGRRGAGAEWAGPLLGSVLEAVVRHAQAPVFTAQAEMRPIKRILVAFDGSDRAVEALKIAAELASRKVRTLYILTVDEGRASRREDWGMGKTQLAARGQNAIHLFVAGHVASEILRSATAEDCDLIVLGSHGHSQFIESFFGSTVDEVLHRAVSPVLICR